MNGPMPEDTSQPTPPQAAEDTSLLSGQIAPVTDVAPVNQSSQTNTLPQEANAGSPPAAAPEAEGGAGGGVEKKSDDVFADYRAKKKAYLANQGQPAPAAPEVVQPQDTSTPPASQAGAEVVPPLPEAAQDGTAAAPDKLPKMRIHPADQQDADLIQAWKTEGAGQPLRQFILERMAPKAPAPEEGRAPATLPDGSEVKTAFTSYAEIQAEIRRLEDAEDDAHEAFNPKAARGFKRRAEELKALATQYVEVEETAHRVEHAAFLEAWNEDLGKARTVFADAGVPGTALETKAIEIRQKWIAENHPLAHVANSATALYAEAAAALGQPAASAAPPAAKVSTPPPTPAFRPPNVIAGGDARTIPARGPVQVTTQNYQEMKAKYLGKNP